MPPTPSAAMKAASIRHRIWTGWRRKGCVSTTVSARTGFDYYKIGTDQWFFLGNHSRFDKRFMYEESLRMPLIMLYPGVVPAFGVNREIVLNVDFAPTLPDFARVDIGADVQGRSFRKIRV